ncbi:hypothetical protein CRENBAI_021862 [Crenichthys baileyi]|uniref:Uncharacterized protein n=1 Tax=Crenichthys baileyi TaxID=28760 RepID=A0AAV9RCH0_9TELE
MLTSLESSSPGFMLLRPSALAQSPQFWILPQPKYSKLRRNLIWFNLQLTPQYQFLQTIPPCQPLFIKTADQQESL